MSVLLLSRAAGSGLRNAEGCSIISLHPDFLAKSVTPLYPATSLHASEYSTEQILSNYSLTEVLY